MLYRKFWKDWDLVRPGGREGWSVFVDAEGLRPGAGGRSAGLDIEGRRGDWISGRVEERVKVWERRWSGDLCFRVVDAGGVKVGLEMEFSRGA